MSQFKFTKKEIEDYLESISYKKCKIKEILFFYKNKELEIYYQKPESYQQINAIINIVKKYYSLGNRETTIDIYSRLCIILTRNLNNQNYFKLINKLKSNNFKNDKDVFIFIRNLMSNNKIKKFYIPDSECFGPKILPENVNSIMDSFKLSKKIKYLDYGFGDGSKTIAISKKLDIPIKNVFGIEHKNEFDGQEGTRKSIKFNYELISDNQDKFNFKNNFFNFATAFVSFHHVKNLDLTLKELNRIIKKNGYLLIQEHDCIDVFDKMLTDLEHTWWKTYNSFKKKTKKIDFDNLDQNNYYSWFEWDIIMKEYGFKKLTYGIHETGQKEIILATRLYYFVYQKVKDI